LGEWFLSLHPLLPVPVAGVEQRPLPVQYPAVAVQEDFDDKELQQVTYSNNVRELHPELNSFNFHRGLRRRAAHFNEYSLLSGYSLRENGRLLSSIKTNLKLSGTYDMDGALTIIDEEKGMYIDQFS
jgi:hypothetical protein